MAIRYGTREQMSMLPPCIEDYVAPDAPVRAYDAIIDALDLKALGLQIEPDRVGCPPYDPVALLKLLVYGYSYGVRSSRKLEREVHYNLSFIWLVGGLQPDHKTIAEFRRRHKEALQKVLRECARICLKLNLIAGNSLFVDGTKMRANASIDEFWDEKRCEKKLEQLQERIEEILKECERVDQEEEGTPGSAVKLRKELADKETLVKKVKAIQERLKSEEKPEEVRVNATDPECVKVKGRQGSHAGYNAQIVVDGQHGLIMNADVVQPNNDLGQLGPQVAAAQEVLGGSCAHAVADAGYAQYEDLSTLSREGIDVVVPSRQQAEQERGSEKKEAPAFAKSRFTYEAERDAYRCPEGQWLDRKKSKKADRAVEYKATAATCRACPHFGACTTSSLGRKVTRYDDEEYREERARRYASAEGQELYKRRKEVAELPFGHIKRNLGAGAFLLRGLEGVRAEMSLLATAFNVARLITLKGVEFLVKLVRSGNLPTLDAATA